MAQNDSVPSNIYTVLSLAALIALAVGIGYLWLRSNELFGPGNPFTIIAG